VETLSVSSIFMFLGMCVSLVVASVLYDIWKHRVKSSAADTDDYDNDEEVEAADDPQRAPAAPPVAAMSDSARNGIAMGRNERNEDLSRNERNERLRVQAELIARLVQAKSLYIADGKGGYKPIGQTALITLATGLAANGRKDSEYGQLRAELERELNPQLVIAPGRPEEHAIGKV
jgi:hypothetical protein